MHSFCTQPSSAMYREFIQSKFLDNEKLGLYKAPRLPAVKLGKILMKEQRVKQPGDVIAMHLDEGFFGSDYFLFTEDTAFFNGGEFKYVDIKTVSSDGKTVEIVANVMSALKQMSFKAKSQEAANVIARTLLAISNHDPQKADEKPDYSQFEGQAIDWLLLRDEVMKTIDMLHERFQDGRLSLIEYEDKKSALLARL